MRYVNLKLTRAEAEAVLSALDCEIPTRTSAALGEFSGERNEPPRGQGAIDDEVPAMERALAKVKAAMV